MNSLSWKSKRQQVIENCPMLKRKKRYEIFLKSCLEEVMFFFIAPRSIYLIQEQSLFFLTFRQAWLRNSILPSKDLEEVLHCWSSSMEHFTTQISSFLNRFKTRFVEIKQFWIVPGTIYCYIYKISDKPFVQFFSSSL